VTPASWVDLAGRFDELPPLEQDPEAVREAADRILADRAYRPPSPAPLERVIDWILDRLEDLLSPFESFVGGLGGGGGGGGTIVAYVILAVAVAFLIRVLLRADWRRTRRDRAGRDEPHVTVSSRPDAAAWRERAAAAEAEGSWRDAVRLRFAVLVAELVTGGVLDAVPGRTAAEYRRELAELRPAAAEPFGRAVRIFEDAWYGDVPVGPDDAAAVRRLTDEVLAVVEPARSAPSRSAP
jgi:hypothetical protein